MSISRALYICRMAADHRRTTVSCKCQHQAHNHDQQDRHHTAFVNQLASTFWQHNWPVLISSQDLRTRWRAGIHTLDLVQWITIFFGAYVCWNITWCATFTLDNFALPYKLHTYFSHSLRVIYDRGPLPSLAKASRNYSCFIILSIGFIFPLLRNDGM